jgi:hypothetical protein
MYFKAIAWLQRKIKTLDGQRGSVPIKMVFEGMLFILLGGIVVYTLVPVFETNATTANITNPTTKTFGDLASWIIPALAFVGLIFVTIQMFLSWKNSHD